MNGLTRCEPTAPATVAAGAEFKVSRFQGATCVLIPFHPGGGIEAYLMPPEGEDGNNIDIVRHVFDGRGFQLALRADSDDSADLERMLTEIGKRMTRPNPEDYVDSDSN
jgi:hypothetical protein